LVKSAVRKLSVSDHFLDDAYRGNLTRDQLDWWMRCYVPANIWGRDLIAEALWPTAMTEIFGERGVGWTDEPDNESAYVQALNLGKIPRF